MIPADAWPRGDRIEWHDDETRTFHDFINETSRPYSDVENAAADLRAARLAAELDRRELMGQALDALASNADFLALGAPSDVKALEQLRSLTRQMSALIRLTVGDLAPASASAMVVPAAATAPISLAGAFADHGLRAGDPDRELDPNAYVKLQSSHDEPSGMVIWTQKVAGDATDVNVDGSVIVKHGKGYEATPGYADTLQVYTLAGSSGTVIGNNDYSGYESTLPYAPGASEAGKGYVRFELGPIWPQSEVGRFNNAGDFMLGGFIVHKPGRDGVTPVRTFTQSGTTVTQVGGNDVFAAEDVGRFLLWDGAGTDGTCDRIVEVVDSVTARVESGRSVTTALSASVVSPGFLVTEDGRPQWSAGNTQSTVGGAGAAAALPAAPKRWLRVLDSDGSTLVIPAFPA